MLSHLKVIELASVLAGPDVGMFFAELGAEVIKIENKNNNGDVTRKWKLASENSSNNISAYFSSVNYHKKYLFLDLKNISERNQVYELAKTSDIIITNFKPGDDVKLKMDYQTLKKINNNIIYGEINGYGEKNNRGAYDVVLQAETGYMSINGEPNRKPMKLPIAFIDLFAAHQLKEGLLLALLQRQKTKKGALVSVSLYDSAVSSLKNQATNWLMNQFIPQRIGSLHPNIAPYGETFMTKDKQLVVLAIGSDKQFKILLQTLKANNLLTKTAYLNNQERVKNRINLANDLAPYFLNFESDKLLSELIDKGVPIGHVKNIKQVFEDEGAKKLVLSEKIGGVETKRVKTCVFKISS